MGRSRDEMIDKRRRQIPKKYQKLYKRALNPRNLRAAVSSQCLECVGWVSEEVRLCTDLACPLYPHRRLDQKALPIAERLTADNQPDFLSSPQERQKRSVESMELICMGNSAETAKIA